MDEYIDQFIQHAQFRNHPLNIRVRTNSAPALVAALNTFHDASIIRSFQFEQSIVYDELKTHTPISMTSLYPNHFSLALVYKSDQLFSYSEKLFIDEIRNLTLSDNELV